MRSKKALYNIVSNLALQLIIIIYGFVVPKIIIKGYGSDVNGLVVSITQFLTYITLLESGFGPVIKSILYKPISKNQKDKIVNILKSAEKFFRNIAKIFIVYIIILSFIYPILVNNQFSALYTVSLILIISITTFFEYYFGITYRIYLEAEQKSYIISLIQIILYIISILVILISSYFNLPIHILKLISGLIFILKPLMQNFYIRKHYQINLNTAKENYNIKNKWDGLAQHIAFVIHTNTDITILTIFSTLKEVSVYSTYLLVVKGIKQLIQAISSGIESSFGDMIARNEIENLNKKFHLYEIIYFSLCTVVFTCTIILITPFIAVYTKGISDANYIRYSFGYLLVISEYIWAIRLPYSTITMVAGHFKETRNGAWIEAFTNIFLSIILVWKYGIIGVTIGTIVAMVIRTLEFVYHTNKYILKRNLFTSVKKILIIIVETIAIILLSKYIPCSLSLSFLNWIFRSCITCFVAIVTVLIINCLFYKKEIKDIFNSIFKKRK